MSSIKTTMREPTTKSLQQLSFTPSILNLLQQLHDVLRESSDDKIVVTSMFSSYLNELLPKLNEVKSIAQDLLAKINVEYSELSRDHEYFRELLLFREEMADNSEVMEQFEMLLTQQGEPFGEEERLTLYLRELQVCGTLLNVLLQYINQFSRPTLLLQHLLTINTSFSSSMRNLNEFLNQYLQSQKNNSSTLTTSTDNTDTTKIIEGNNNTPIAQNDLFKLYEPCSELIGFICFLLYRCYDSKIINIIQEDVPEERKDTVSSVKLEVLDNALIFDSEYHYQQELQEEQDRLKYLAIDLEKLQRGEIQPGQSVYEQDAGDEFKIYKKQQLSNLLLVDIVQSHFASIDLLFECLEYFVTEQYLQEPIVNSYYKLSQKMLLQQKEWLAQNTPQLDVIDNDIPKTDNKTAEKNTEPTEIIDTAEQIQRKQQEQYWEICELEREQREIVTNPELLASRKRLVSLFNKQQEFERKKQRFLDIKAGKLPQDGGEDYDPDEAQDVVNEAAIEDDEFLQFFNDKLLEDQVDDDLSDKMSVIGSEQDEQEAIRYHKEVRGEIADAIAASGGDADEVLSQYTYTYTYTYAYTAATTIPFPVSPEELKKQQELLAQANAANGNGTTSTIATAGNNNHNNNLETYEITSIFTNYSDDDQVVQKHSDATLKLMQSKIELYPNQLMYNNQRFKTKIEEIELTFASKKQGNVTEEDETADENNNNNDGKQKGLPPTLNLFDDDDDDSDQDEPETTNNTDIMLGKTLQPFNQNEVFNNNNNQTQKEKTTTIGKNNKNSLSNLESILSLFHIVRRSLHCLYHDVIEPTRHEQRSYQFEEEEDEDDDEEDKENNKTEDDDDGNNNNKDERQDQISPEDDDEQRQVLTGIKDLLILDVLDMFEQDYHVVQHVKSLLYQILMEIKDQTISKDDNKTNNNNTTTSLPTISATNNTTTTTTPTIDILPALTTVPDTSIIPDEFASMLMGQFDVNTNNNNNNSTNNTTLSLLLQQTESNNATIKPEQVDNAVTTDSTLDDAAAGLVSGTFDMSTAVEVSGFNQFDAFAKLMDITKQYVVDDDNDNDTTTNDTNTDNTNDNADNNKNTTQDILTLLDQMKQQNEQLKQQQQQEKQENNNNQQITTTTTTESLRSIKNRTNNNKHPIYTVLENTEHYLFLLTSQTTHTLGAITQTIALIGESVQQQMEEAEKRDAIATLRELDDVERKQEEERLAKEEKMLKEKGGARKKKIKLKRVQRKRKRTADEMIARRNADKKA